MTLLKFIAERRFNVIDVAGAGLSYHQLATGNWLLAIVFSVVTAIASGTAEGLLQRWGGK